MSVNPSEWSRQGPSDLAGQIISVAPRALSQLVPRAGRYDIIKVSHSGRLLPMSWTRHELPMPRICEFYSRIAMISSSCVPPPPYLIRSSGSHRELGRGVECPGDAPDLEEWGIACRIGRTYSRTLPDRPPSPHSMSEGVIAFGPSPARERISSRIVPMTIGVRGHFGSRGCGGSKNPLVDGGGRVDRLCRGIPLVSSGLR